MSDPDPNRELDELECLETMAQLGMIGALVVIGFLVTLALLGIVIE